MHVPRITENRAVCAPRAAGLGRMGQRGFAARWGDDGHTPFSAQGAGAMSTPWKHSSRERLPNRRGSINFNVEWGTFTYMATPSFFPDGRLAEIFLGNGKAGST